MLCHPTFLDLTAVITFSEKYINHETLQVAVSLSFLLLNLSYIQMFLTHKKQRINYVSLCLKPFVLDNTGEYERIWTSWQKPFNFSREYNFDVSKSFPNIWHLHFQNIFSSLCSVTLSYNPVRGREPMHSRCFFVTKKYRLCGTNFFHSQEQAGCFDKIAEKNTRFWETGTRAQWIYVRKDVLKLGIEEAPVKCR
jgi:hypothetical protein